MTTLVRQERAVELEDVQGLVRFAYGHLPEVCVLLLRVKNPTAARAWLANVKPTTAVKGTPPKTALNVAFTSEGLREVAVAPELRDGFSFEFDEGMAGNSARTHRLGDVGANDPCEWLWGVGDRVPHVAVLLYADRACLAAWEASVAAQWGDGFVCIGRLTSAPPPDALDCEPFGFKDGISQPDPDWRRERPLGDHDRLAYDNLVCLGEFLLGYPNEYGLYTPRPVLDPRHDPNGWLLRAEDAPDKADLGRNGSYLVIRQLQQNVQGFRDTLARLANGDAAERERLAAAMVGRTTSGEPLVGVRTGAVRHDDAPLNDFDYESDPRGVRCPLGAHIRRVNPRNADLPPGTPGILSRLCRMLGLDATARDRDLVASTRFHRLLRRGRRYGAGADTGIHFMCVVANIKRQFEFVQSAWVMGTKFDGLTGESDPLLGNRRPDAGGFPTDGFSMPQADGPDRRVDHLPQFVTVRGGAYFFLPGIRALRCIAGARGGA